MLYSTRAPSCGTNGFAPWWLATCLNNDKNVELTSSVFLCRLSLTLSKSVCLAVRLSVSQNEMAHSDNYTPVFVLSFFLAEGRDKPFRSSKTAEMVAA